MISAENIKKAIYDIYPSEMLGITMCQANYYIMGEDLDKVITDFAKKIFFVHFRNTSGSINKFRETFHDNGELNMAHLIRLYKKELHDPDNDDHVITHLEPDILECEVKWALESVTTNKASGGDGIPGELFQILKDDT